MNCKVAEQFFEVFHSLQEQMRQPKDFGNGIPLYHSEVAFLDAVSRNPKANVSALSAELMLTKGAVTQAYQKLSRKGLIEMYKRSDNKKEKYFRLTEPGEQARACHQQFHDSANQQICHYFSALDDRESKVIFDFLENLKQCVPFCEFSCRCETPKEDKNETTDIIECPRAARRAR